MPTFNPPSIPRRPKSNSVAASILFHLHLFYFRYSITFGLYVMDPVEKLIFNSIIFSVFGIILYYLFPLAISTLAYVVLYWARVPKADSLKVERFIRDVNPGAVATLTEGGAPPIDTTSFYEF